MLLKLLQRLRVFLGFIFAVVYVIFARPGLASIVAGFVIALAGLALRAWACGHLRKERSLDITGPYAYMRNPLYFGSFLIAIGFAAASGVWWLAILSLILFLSIYLPVMYVEAEELEEVLGEEYREYAAAVPLFFPRLKPWKKSERGFDFQLYLKNGEYNAALGLLAASVVLTVKAFIFG